MGRGLLVLLLAVVLIIVAILIGAFLFVGIVGVWWFVAEVTALHVLLELHPVLLLLFTFLGDLVDCIGAAADDDCSFDEAHGLVLGS